MENVKTETLTKTKKEVVEKNPGIFWDEETSFTKSGHTCIKYYFNNEKCYNYLQSQGFYRYKLLSGNFIFIRIQNNVVKEVEPKDIRDFVVTALKTDLNKLTNEKVRNMFYRGSKNYISIDSLAHLDYIELKFIERQPDREYLFFKNCIWEITKDKIKTLSYTDSKYHVWEHTIIDFEAELIKNIFRISKEDSKFSIDNKCSDSDFWKFLDRTSQIFWDCEEKTELQITEETTHLVNKITALGYLLHTYKDPSKPWAVISIDSKDSAIGESQGGSGKSLLGKAVSILRKKFFINGKRKNLTDDKFIFDGVDERTEFIFIDDCRKDLNFDFFFPYLTTDFEIEQKGQHKFTIPYNNSPKMYFSTNHMIGVNDSSTLRRQFHIAFSDYYNEKRKPVDDLGRKLFEDWDSDQWNQFYSIMAHCIKEYFQLDQVEAPQENIEKRKLRREMGDDFLDWASTYFSENSHKLNTSILKSDLDNDFRASCSAASRSVTVTNFKRKLKAFCMYSGYVFNPLTDGKDEKRDSREYIHIGYQTEDMPF